MKGAFELRCRLGLFVVVGSHGVGRQPFVVEPLGTVQTNPIYKNSFYKNASLECNFVSEECTKNVSLVLGFKWHNTIAEPTLDHS